MLVFVLLLFEAASIQRNTVVVLRPFPEKRGGIFPVMTVQGNTGDLGLRGNCSFSPTGQNKAVI